MRNKKISSPKFKVGDLVRCERRSLLRGWEDLVVVVVTQWSGVRSDPARAKRARRKVSKV
jgi:hypothetical protein